MSTEKGGYPVPTRETTGTIAATGFTNWLRLLGQGEHVFTCNVRVVSAPVGTFTVEMAAALPDGSVGTVQTVYSSTNVADFPQVGRLAGDFWVRMNCTAYTSGQFDLSVSQ